MVREGIGLLIQKLEYINIVGECSNGEEALRCVNKLHPEVVVTDIYMPILGGIQLASRLRQENPEIGVVILTAAQDKDLALTAMNVGAFGYLLKCSDPAEIGIAIRAAVNRKIYVTPRINDVFLSDRVRATNLASSLTCPWRIPDYGEKSAGFERCYNPACAT
jgi:DNA-binding NarL/FixJ family response regulator